jgi:hypothetical protein
MVMSQLALDPGDAIHLAGHWQADPLPSRRVDPPALLLQESLWDGIVPNATSETLARALGLPLAEPSPSVVPLLPTVTTPTCGAPASAMAQWYVSDDDFAAHLAMEDEGVQDQLLRWLASWGPGGLRGDIAFPDQGACP